jgi:hypothetical protein
MEPSVLTQHDIEKAREHLRAHLAKDQENTTTSSRTLHHNSQQSPDPPIAITKSSRRAKNNPTYNLDALSKIDSYTTSQRLWTLRKYHNFNVGIGTSCIPEANRGLFTMKERNDSDFICPYLGQIQKRDRNQLTTGEYTFYDPTLDQYVHGNPATSYGPYANDPLNERMANAKITFRKERNEYWLQALGPIACNSEILLMYGVDFWLANNLIPTEVLDIAYPRHLRRAARCVLEQGQC